MISPTGGATCVYDGAASSGDAAQQFGFVGDRQAARLLTVPPASGDNAAHLEARFLNCLFQR